MPNSQYLNAPASFVVKALIVYEDFGSAARANGMLQRAALDPNIDIRWDIKPWRLDMLKFPPTAEEALTEALDAHLIVFAGNCAQFIPTWLQNWLEHWTKCRRVPDAALAVIRATSDDTFPTLATSELSLFAASHGLKIIFDEDVTSVPFSLNRGSAFIQRMPDAKDTKTYWISEIQRNVSASIQ